MKSKFLIGLLIAFMGMISLSSCERIDAGHEGIKEANQLREQALTPAILEKMWIEKWDGKLPVYGQVPTIFKDISK